ncbi:MAG: Sensor protein ZraS [Cryomorphaceae bacterium]|nr:MAG: Sensor protein ZraS [Cryomorphaceae bacterium]
MNTDVYSKKIWWKVVLIVSGVIIGVVSLLYTETFLRELRMEEERKIRLWAKAVEAVFGASEEENLAFYSEIIQNNQTIPVILTDGQGSIIAHRNLNVPEGDEEKLARYLERKLAEFKASGQMLENSFGDGQTNYLYYKGSTLLTKLRYYPLLLLGVISVYMLISYMAFSNARRSEQNKVWTGMAKETAHQIGTPLSALLGWIAFLKEQYPKEIAFGEMEKDIDRLSAITERFSKIGSQPELAKLDLSDTLDTTLAYLSKRMGRKIQLDTDVQPDLQRLHNEQLISWVIENLVKNATDALEGEGSISVHATVVNYAVVIQVSDTGRGIPANVQRKIFSPGFTTKTRGWGLGLSLAKRIIAEYHAGSITLAESTAEKGTTFKIVLPLA